MDMEETLSTVA